VHGKAAVAAQRGERTWQQTDLATNRFGNERIWQRTDLANSCLSGVTAGFAVRIRADPAHRARVPRYEAHCLGRINGISSPLCHYKTKLNRRSRDKPNWRGGTNMPIHV
jgi:hypothetical protein